MKTILSDSELGLVGTELIIETPDNGKLIPLGKGPSEGNGRGGNIPELIKELIAVDSNSGGDLTQKELAKVYGVSQASVSHLSNGKRGTNLEIPKDNKLETIVNETRNQVGSMAVQKLMETLDRFEPAGLSDQMEIVTAAQKISSIVEKMLPASKGNERSGEAKVILHLYGPRQAEESSYTTIEVG